jgi:hypothetical protein
MGRSVGAAAPALPRAAGDALKSAEKRQRPDWQLLWRVDRRLGVIEPRFPTRAFFVAIADVATAEGALGAVLWVARECSDVQLGAFVRAVNFAYPRAVVPRRRP